MKKLIATTAALAVLAASPSALAALLYEFDTGSGRFGNSSLNLDQRQYNNISTSYNDRGIFSFGTDFGAAPADGFWLVVNAGGNPKGIRGELAIFYGDLSSGQLTAYEYDGRNSSTSWSNLANELQDFGTAIQTNGNAFNFSIDVSAMNERTDLGTEWRGAQFAEQVGIWYHPSWGTTMTSDPFSYGYSQQGWYDVSYRNTLVTDVPEPGTIALFGSALLGLFGLRRKRLA